MLRFRQGQNQCFFYPPEGKFLPLGEISTRPKGKIFKNLPLEETFFRSSEDISEEFRDLNTFEAKNQWKIETAMNYSKIFPLRGPDFFQESKIYPW